MSLLALQKNAQRKTGLIQALLTGGGLLLIGYTLFDWLVFERTLYTGYTARHFNDYVIFMGWLFFSVSFYLLRRWAIKEGVLLRSGLLACSIGLFLVSFAYFFNGWIDGISFPGFVISYYPGTIITSLGLIACLFGLSRGNQPGLFLSRWVLISLLVLLLLSCFLPLYYFSSSSDKQTATIVRGMGHVLLGVVFVLLGFSIKKSSVRDNS